MIVNNVRVRLVKQYTYAVHAPHSALPYCWFYQDFLHLCVIDPHPANCKKQEHLCQVRQLIVLLSRSTNKP